MKPLDPASAQPHLTNITLSVHESPTVALTDQQRRVLLIDPTTLTRECFAHMLRRHAAGFVVDSAVSLEAAGEGRPDAVVFNVHAMPIDNGRVLRQIAEIRARFADVPLLVIAESDDRRMAMTAIRHGLRGYLPTTLTAQMLAAAIGLVLAGGTFVPEPLIGADAVAGILPADPPAPAALTQRESEVLALLRQGKPNKLIAYDLAIAESTVKVHVRSIMKKLRATNRTQLAVLSTAPPRLPARQEQPVG